MINKESIISSFDDKPTLLEWLKKVEAALKGASASSFKVNKKGDATLTFSIVFDDGSELETGPITMQQGESVQAATIRNGHLILTLTNGDELDAGDLGGVSGFSINASQHLIVTYQNGTTQDLGAIFSGNVVISGNLTIGDGAVSTPILTSASDQIEAQKPIVEVMSGYEYEPATLTGITQTPVYVGAVKNGNKLTLCIALKINRSAEATNTYMSIGRIKVPANIYSRLYPVSVGGSSILDTRLITCAVGIVTNTTLTGYCYKDANNQLFFGIYSAQQLTAGTDYYVRYEVTFLLSDSIAA